MGNKNTSLKYSKEILTTSTPVIHDKNGPSDTYGLSRLSVDLDGSYWSNLLSTVPGKRDSQIHHQHVVVALPVCLVGKDASTIYTSMEVITKAVRQQYPNLVIKDTPKTTEPEVNNVSEQSEPSTKLERKLSIVDEQLALNGSKDIRRPSIDDNSSELSEPSINMERKLSIVEEQLGKDAHRKLKTNRRKMSINTCITTMREDKTDYENQLAGVQTMANFADEEESLKVLFLKPDGIACTIDAMKIFLDKEELQTDACVTLLKMASTAETNCTHIVEQDGLSAITTSLRRHQDNKDIVSLQLEVLAYISTSVDLTSHLLSSGLHTEVLGAMSRHSSNRDIVRESCFIIGNLLRNVETTQQLMLVGAVHTIINMVRDFPDDPSILENACRTLGSFACYDETCLDVSLAGATTTVVQAMTSQGGHEAVQECGCWALASLTADEATCKELITLNVVEILVSVMKEFPEEENIQDYSVRVLYNLSDFDSTVQSVCTADVVQLLGHIMSTYRGHVELLEIASIVVSHVVMALHTKRLVVDIQGVDIISVLVTTMLDLPENHLIQEYGCKTIANLAVEGDLRKLLEMRGVSKAVISAMLFLDTSSEIQEVGCLALMNLSADNRDNKVRMKNSGAVSTLLHTLREFDQNQTVVLCALKALGNLVILEEVCHLILDEAGLDTIVSLVTKHEEDREIIAFIAMVLCGLTELSDLKEEEVNQIDRTLVELLADSHTHAECTLYVCQAIENLTRTGIGRETFSLENRLGVILSAMNLFPASSNIHRCCCKVIAIVVFYIESQRRLITETTLKSVLTSMTLFPLDVELQIICCGTISCIVEKIDILKHEVIGQGGVALIQKAVQTHRAEPRLAVVALMALSNVVPIDCRLYPKDSNEAFRTILLCMAQYIENLEVQSAGCQALAKINLSDSDDVNDCISHVTAAMKRYTGELNLEQHAANALRKIYANDKYTSKVDKILEAPYFLLSKQFYKSLLPETDSKIAAD